MSGEQPENPRSPAAIARHALSMADGAQNTTQALKAVVTAIVALAGEVHQLGESKKLQRVKVHADTLTVGSMDLSDFVQSIWEEDDPGTAGN